MSNFFLNLQRGQVFFSNFIGVHKISEIQTINGFNGLWSKILILVKLIRKNELNKLLKSWQPNSHEELQSIGKSDQDF